MTDGLQLLEIMLADMDRAAKEFRPTNFWDSGVAAVVAELREHGFEHFREREAALRYFVPSYGDRFYHRNKRRVDWWLGRLSEKHQKSVGKVVTGLDKARTDYRLFRATVRQSALNLDQISESGIGGGERYRFDDKSYSRSLLNYLRALTLLDQEADTSDITSWMEIGGGYGTLGEIALTGRDDTFYVNIDIPPVAAVSTWYLKRVFGDDAVLDYAESRSRETIDLENIRKSHRAVVLCPWQLPRLKGRSDVFVNFISFQEMEPAVVENYIRIIQPMVSRHVLTRNSRFGKALASHAGAPGVIEQVTTDRIISAFDAFTLNARESLVNGDETPDRSFRSEVVLMSRNAQHK